MSNSTRMTTVGVSIPRKVLSELDNLRGDITRSKFLLRIIEAKISEREIIKNGDRLEGLEHHLISSSDDLRGTKRIG
jgi:metal-responsive CopG/Arc/MetJ family transcriptional regulator